MYMRDPPDQTLNGRQMPMRQKSKLSLSLTFTFKIFMYLLWFTKEGDRASYVGHPVHTP